MFNKAFRDIGCDFQYYSLASSAFLSGNNPYQTGTTFPFVYPLFFCVLISPLVILPFWLQHLVWYIVTFLSLFLIMFLWIRYYFKVITGKELLILLIPFFLLFRVIHNNLANGQVTIIVLLLCVLFLYNYLRSNRFAAALFLSAAISIKLTPLILLVYVLFRRDVLMIGLVILFSLVLSLLVPYIIAGSKVFEYYTFYYNTFFNENVISNVHFSPVEYAFGFSLVSVIRYFIPLVSKFYGMIIAGVLTVTPIIYVQMKNGKNDIQKQTQIFSLYMLTMLLISPLGETSHLIYLYPAMLITTFAVFQDLQRYLKYGVIILILILISFIIGRFYISTNLIAIIILYSTIIWVILGSENRMRPTKVIE